MSPTERRILALLRGRPDEAVGVDAIAQLARCGVGSIKVLVHHIRHGLPPNEAIISCRREGYKWHTTDARL